MDRGVSRIVLVGFLVMILIVASVAYYLLIVQKPGQTPQQVTQTMQATQITSIMTIPTITTPAMQQRDMLRVAVGIDIDTLDPHGQTTGTVINILRHVYETLFWFDDEGKKVVPWLAERWEVSPDGLVYTLYLRKGIKFHDGSEFNATVVKANLDRWIDPTVRVPARAQLGPVNGTEVIDRYTVKIYLSRPYAPFITVLASFPMTTSLDVIKRFGNQTITEVVGTGPYKFVSWEKGRKVVLERFDDYWGQKPAIKRIEWLIIPEASTRIAALLSGDVDFAFNLPPTDLDRVRGDNRFEVVTPTSNRIIFIAILPKGPLKDPKVRQALNYAVDKEAIIKNVLYGLGIDSVSPLPPHFFGYARMDPYVYDPQRARKLLEEAGFPFDRKLVLLHPTGRYLQDKQVAEAVQAYLSRIGLQVELRTMDWPSFVASITKPLDQKDYDLLLLGWGAAAPDAHFILFNQFHSSQAPPRGLAAAHYNNSIVDELLERAIVETDPQKRAELYRQAIEIIWKDAPWIFLYTQKNFAAKVANLEGIMVHYGESFFFVKAYFK
ncbi:MAG: ABC transporter substrate-binding protein [Desulfurococcales archaeon]|jgi:peptide/nickel transport system substrate-binding protein|nr:ABC transporter substrate-binding protein [Desulfurococcales archaeon]